MDTVLRSLLAFSLLFPMGSGLRRERSTPNRSLRSPGVEVSEEGDMREADKDTGPTWEQWRWESDRFEIYTPFGNASLSRGVNVPDFTNCARFSSPSPNQFSKLLDQDMTYHIMLLADHIYCLCVQCNLPKFPSSWAGHVSIVDALEADKCLQQQHLSHYAKATTLHKLVVWASRQQHHRTVMVLEEDFTLQDSRTAANVHKGYNTLGKFIGSESWDFLRFGHMPWKFLDSEGRCRRECRCVKESLSHDVCTPSIGCDIRSSVAYMVAIRESIVNRFLGSPGVIDTDILQGFRQSYIVPAIIHQSSGWYSNNPSKEVVKGSSFRNQCYQ